MEISTGKEAFHAVKNTTEGPLCKLLTGPFSFNPPLLWTRTETQQTQTRAPWAQDSYFVDSDSGPMDSDSTLAKIAKVAKIY